MDILFLGGRQEDIIPSMIALRERKITSLEGEITEEKGIYRFEC